MKTRRYGLTYSKGNMVCDCYHCTGDIIDYREKKALAFFEDSMLEYASNDSEQTEMINIGDTVEFKEKVFHPPYYPFYENYKGHRFEVIRKHYGDHLELQCLTGDVVVNGYVDDYQVFKVED